MLGIFDLRGHTVSVIDTHLRFDMKPSSESGNFVIVGSQSGRLALRVDEVLGIEPFEDADIDRDSNLLTNSDDKVVAGVGKRGALLTVLLDPNYLATSEVELAAA